GSRGPQAARRTARHGLRAERHGVLRGDLQAAGGKSRSAAGGSPVALRVHDRVGRAASVGPAERLGSRSRGHRTPEVLRSVRAVDRARQEVARSSLDGVTLSGETAVTRYTLQDLGYSWRTIRHDRKNVGR